MRNNMVRGEQYKGLLKLGQRVHSILYGGRDGMIFEIHGEQNPESIRSLGGGCMVMGGAASMDVVFTGYGAHISKMLPECIIRGVQWYIGEEIAPYTEILEAIHAADVKELEDKAKAKTEAERQAQTRQALPAKYPHLIPLAKAPKTSSHALGAKNIKTELARAFPGIKFSAKSESYSGGCSIDVSWTDGPTEEQVKPVINGYQEGHFNGMEDIYEHDHSNVWPSVFGGAKYVSGNRHIDPAGYTAMVKDLCRFYKVEYQTDEWRIQMSKDHMETATHIVNQIIGANAVPAGYRITGLEHIPFVEGETARAGNYSDFYRVKMEPKEEKISYKLAQERYFENGPVRVEKRNSVLDLILAD